MTAAAETKITAGDLAEAIRSRYEPPEWHVEGEVTLGRRRLDVVAFNLWGARGWRIVGFELKVDRGDWLRELRAFEKSEEWLSVVDSFYLVTPPKLVKPEELPAEWGLLELCGSRMMTRKAGVPREPRPTLPREVAARFFTRLKEAMRNQEMLWRDTVYQEARKEAEGRIRENLEHDMKLRRDESAAKAEKYDELCAALGWERYDFQIPERTLRIFRMLKAADADRGIALELRRSLALLQDGATKTAALLKALDEAAA